jgi:hypothetical protein
VTVVTVTAVARKTHSNAGNDERAKPRIPITLASGMMFHGEVEAFAVAPFLGGGGGIQPMVAIASVEGLGWRNTGGK